jgi:serine/threonine-protein kinase
MSSPAPAQPGIRPGEILAGKYRVERVLGQGGMGIVVAAHHLQLDERVALKFLLPEALGNPEAVSRFVREARAAVKIKNEHVARVTDVGQLESGSPFMVMEYLEGIDLAAWLKQRGAMGVDQAVDFVLQTCEAIADAHMLGIVHRDLKPANLFCIQRSDGQLCIKVLDFGISKVTTPGSAHDMTRTSALMGSPLYMSPEQMIQSRGVDARTDIWSLGIILFELLTGHPPFDADAVTELAIKVANDPTPSLRSFRPDSPVGLEAAVGRCLEKDRARRFQTVGELAYALKDYGSRTSRGSVERVLGTLRQAGVGFDSLGVSSLHTQPVQPASAAPPNTTSSWGQTGPRVRTTGARAAIVVLSLLVVAVAVASAVAVVLARRGPHASLPIASASSPPETPSAAPALASVLPASSLPPIAPAPPAPEAAAASVVAAPLVASSPVTRPGWRTSVGPRLPAGPGAAVTSAAPTAKPDCDPPYYMNDKGSRIFKKECL